MSLDLWTFTRWSGQDDEAAENTPVYQNSALVYEPELEGSDGTVIRTQAQCGLEAHWDQLRMQPKATDYSGHLKVGNVNIGTLLLLRGNGLESFSIAITNTDVIIELQINGAVINRAFSTIEDQLDMRWRVGSDSSIFICNGDEITAGGVEHGSVLWWAEWGDAPCEIQQIYLVDNALTDEQLRART